MKNVILLTVDALRKDMLGCYGKGISRTPFLDSIQDRCIIFTKAQSSGPYTQAAFPGILTSSFFLEYGRHKKLPTQKTIISEVLKKNSITTAAFHSNAYLSYYFGYNRGWDEFYDSMEIEDIPDMYPFVRGNVLNEKVKKWLTNYVKKDTYKPFFLWIHYMDVHEPYIPEKSFVDIVDPSIDMSKEQMFSLFVEVLRKRDVSDTGKVNLLKKLYGAKVLETDTYIRELFKIVEELGILEDTIIIITADHGDEFGEHGGLSHDGKMYAELIDIPLLVYDSQINSAISYDSLVSNIDIAPTIARNFNVDIPDSFLGKPLLPLQEYCPTWCYGEAIEKKGYKEKETDRPIYFYREGDLKLIYTERENAWEMYDLEKDPEEKNNIIGEFPQAEAMKNKLLSVMKSYKKIR